MSANEPEDYEVGYGKPPKNTQFQPGQSGNPKGRPKGAKNIKTVIENEIYQAITYTEGGMTKKASKLELFVKTLTADALKSKPPAQKMLLDLIREHFPEEGTQTPSDAKLTEEDLEILNNYAAIQALIDAAKKDG